jgi:predicted lipoprotein with Yx(FWY)xxD motif
MHRQTLIEFDRCGENPVPENLPMLRNGGKYLSQHFSNPAILFLELDMTKSKLLVLGIFFGMLLSACAGAATSTPPMPTVSSTQAATAAPTETPAPTTATNITPVVPSTGTIDWMGHGFATVLATQMITATTPITITNSPYSIRVPANAFPENVTFSLLQGEAANYQSQLPSGETPILAFAFDVKNPQGQLIGKFDNPVILTINDARITANSKYYNLAPDGALTPNPTGMHVKAGELSHPITGTGVAWVITSPASSASAGAAQATTLQVANNPKLGNILVNSAGFTLYVFKEDSPGQSTCSGSCAKLWPPLTISKDAHPTAATDVKGLLGVIQRSDGSYQVIYNGAPLYLYTGDTKPGETNGQGIKNLWFVIPVG